MIPTGFGADKTALDNIDWCGFGIGANLATVDVKDNRILRVRPFKYDAAYSVDHLKPFRLQTRGQGLRRAAALAHPADVRGLQDARLLAATASRIPLKRVDWDPEGERNPQNRGIVASTSASAGTRPPTSSPRRSSRIDEEHGRYSILLPGRRPRRDEDRPRRATAAMANLLDHDLGGFTMPGPPARQLGGLVLGRQARLGHASPVGAGHHRATCSRTSPRTRDAVLLLGLRPRDHARGAGAGQHGQPPVYWFTEMRRQADRAPSRPT